MGPASWVMHLVAPVGDAAVVQALSVLSGAVLLLLPVLPQLTAAAATLNNLQN